MHIAHATAYCTFAGINNWLRYLIAATRHKIAWGMYYAKGQYLAQQEMRVWGDVTFSNDFWAYLDMVRPDIIHLTYQSSYASQALEYRDEHGTPVVVTLHGASRAGENIRRNLPLMDAVIVPSKTMYDIFADWDDMDNLTLIHHGVADFKDLGIVRYNLRDRFDIPDDNIIVGWVGRIHDEKGWQRAVDLAEEMSGLPIHIVVAGVGQTAPENANMANAVAEVDNIHWMTGVSMNSMPAFYKGLDVLLATSSFESFGLAVCEAAWEEVPCVVFRCGAMEELLGAKGIIVDTEDEAMNALAALLDPSLRADVGRRLRMRMRAKKFTATRMGDEYLELYEKLLEEKDGK